MTSLLLISFKIFLFYPRNWHPLLEPLSLHMAPHSFPCLREGGTEIGGLAQAFWGWLSLRAQPQSHLLFSHSAVTDSLWPHGLQHTRLPCPSLPLKVTSAISRPMPIESVMPSNHLVLFCPFLLLPSTFPSIRVFFGVGVLHPVAKVLELQLQHSFFQWTFRVDFL